MSLKSLATKALKNVQKVQSNSTFYGNTVSISSSSNKFLLRNEAGGTELGTFLSNGMKSIFSPFGAKDNKYIIGRLDSNLFGTDNLVTRAVSSAYNTLTGENQQRGVVIDGYDEMNAELTVGLPSQPVMYTTSVVNQRVRNPDTFKMRVYVTNLNSDDIVDSMEQSVMNFAGGLGNLLLNPETRAFKALNDLKWLQENGEPFKIYTPVRIYENMLIEKISPISNKSNYDTLVADIYFREIILAKSLGDSSKASARTAPSPVANTFAKAKKWIRG